MCSRVNPESLIISPSDQSFEFMTFFIFQFGKEIGTLLTEKEYHSRKVEIFNDKVRGLKNDDSVFSSEDLIRILESENIEMLYFPEFYIDMKNYLTDVYISEMNSFNLETLKDIFSDC